MISPYKSAVIAKANEFETLDQLAKAHATLKRTRPPYGTDYAEKVADYERALLAFLKALQTSRHNSPLKVSV